jgi:hypothetical protein
MRRWEALEEFMYDNDMDGAQFTSTQLATEMGLTRTEASSLIQSHLNAQTSRKAHTLYVLTRTGRTRNALWHAGARADNARMLGLQTGDDFRRRIDRVLAPTLERIGQKNPRALPAARAVLQGIDAGVKLIESMLA